LKKLDKNWDQKGILTYILVFDLNLKSVIIRTLFLVAAHTFTFTCRTMLHLFV